MMGVTWWMCKQGSTETDQQSTNTDVVMERMLNPGIKGTMYIVLAPAITIYSVSPPKKPEQSWMSL